MSSYDLFMIAVLAACVVLGAVKGMAWQIASLSSLVVSYLIATRFHGVISPMIKAQEPWNTGIAMLILFAGTSLVIWLAFRGVRGMIEKFRLKEFDRQMGALFGAVKGAAICLVITFFAVTLSETARKSVLDSKSGYYISVVLEKGHDFLPERIHDRIHDHYHEFQAKLTGEAPDHHEEDDSFLKGGDGGQLSDPTNNSGNGFSDADLAERPGNPNDSGDLSRQIDDFFKDRGIR